MTMSRDEISKHRKHLRELLGKIEKQAFFCAHTDDLIQGVASEVFRRCGKKGCKCADDDTKRHGPYLVVQLYENKKQRQVALRSEEKNLWQMVKNYQIQINSLLDLKKTCTELCNAVGEIIKMRLKKLERS
ncbi:MAG TPA: DUF6788 family protein [Candidatus Babeliales bacterium]|nr:DUF6788 family protein [Candidatus Babeliales bacterium]